MTQNEAREAIRKGYYRDTLEAEELHGLIRKYFPEDYDPSLTIEELVTEVVFGR